MTMITIPKKMAAHGDLVILPRREYELLLESKRETDERLTPAQKKALTRADRRLKRGEALTYHDLARSLGAKG